MKQHLAVNENRWLWLFGMKKRTLIPPNNLFILILLTPPSIMVGIDFIKGANRTKNSSCDAKYFPRLKVSRTAKSLVALEEHMKFLLPPVHSTSHCQGTYQFQLRPACDVK